MDYDDNDFQSQNLQLAGEGSNKFPPVLQPYALPKFDFDDSLHGHLRFDSLVETEVYLGIENEDNQWIEEFTRGSCGIRFSSGAAESCSISRCNNVWSEAASSESVEMLLKSVGQEELILAQADPKEPDARDELGCVIKHMEPSVKQDDDASSKAADVTDLEFTPISGEAQENLSVLDANIVRHTSQVEDTSQTDEDDATVDDGLGDVTGITVEAMENNSSIGRERNDANQNEGNTVVSTSMDDRIEISSQVDRMVASTQSIITLEDRLSNKDEPDHANASAHANQEEQHLYIQETQMGDPNLDVNVHVTGASPLEIPLCSVSAEATGKDEVKTKLNNMDESCLKMEEGSKFSEDMNIRDQSCFGKAEVPLMRNEDGTTFETHKIDDSIVSHSGDDNSVNQSVAPLSSAEYSEASEGKIDARSKGTVSGNSSLTLACSSGEFLVESHIQGHAPLTLAADSSEPGEKNAVHGQGGVHECTQDTPIDQKKSVQFAFDRSDMACEVVESCIIDKEPTTGSTETELIVSEVKSDVPAGNESAPNVTVRSADVVAFDRVDGTAVLPGDGISADAVMDDKVVEMPSLRTVGFTHADKQEEINDNVSVEAPLSDLKNYTVPEYEKSTSSDAADLSQSMEGSCSTQSQSVSHSALTSTVSEKYMPEVEAHPPLCDSNAKRDDSVVLVKESDEKASLNLLEPTLSHSDNLQFAPGESQEDANQKGRKEDETVKASEGLNNRQIAVYVTNERGSVAAIDRPENGSPTIVKATELSQKGSDKKGADRLPEQTPLVSEITGGDAKKALSAPYNTKQNDALKDDKSFTFEITPLKDLPQNDACENWQPISLQASKQLPVVEEPPSVSGSSQLDSKIVAHASPKVPDVAVVHSSAKGNTERKTRRGSGTPTRKESSKKRNPVKETTPVRLERGEKLSNISLSHGISPVVQPSEMQRYGLLDSSGVKPFSLATSTSGLPDVNSSGPLPSVGFHQPFTDMQQLQLRAQIFVYGALIQGTAPDEACMMSAFGGPDGGRSNWDIAWRSCIERLHGKKSHLTTPEAPVQSRSAPDQVVNQGNLQSKAIASPAIWTSSKVTPIVNPMVPPSSPLWNLPTPSGDTLQPSGIPRGPVEYHRPLSPLHPLQTPNMRNYVGHSPSSWIPQSPFGGPWGASHTTTLDATGRFPMHLSVTEFQSTPLKEPSAMHSSGTKHVSIGLVAPSGASASASTGITHASDSKKVTALSSLPSTEPKPRKRKKTLVSESPAQDSVHTQHLGSTPAPAVTANPSTAAVMSSTGFPSKDPKGRISAPLSSARADLIKDNQNVEQRATLSETFGKVKEARMLAEDAASLAAAAVSHSQEIWNQLDRQKSSGLLEDTETKLASAAVAIAAAAAVAKAAAAAANVASNAALQAKLMADEAVLSSGYSHSDGMKNLGQASPASILKGDDGTNNSSSILFAAREAARKNVEAASAASKRAENVDAIVRAAELAAEAVSQAGKIVALGDPLLLTELVAAGPEGYWKATQVSSGLVSKVTDVSRENPDNDNIKKGPDSSSRQLKEAPQDKKETQTTKRGKEPVAPEVSIEENMRLVDGLSDPVVGGAKDAKGKKGRKSSEFTKVADVLESESGSRLYVSAQNEYDKLSESLKESNIMEGSHVEIFKDGSGFKAAWFSANILSLKDGKAYVCYTDVASGEGLEKLKEWVSLKGDGGEAPKIRVARRVTAMPFEGTRKRRRAATGDYSWSVGDRVDAWIQDSWWEGVITEKNKKDESMLTVHFPVQEETSVVRAWHLRPSLVWKDGEWIEWSSSRSNSSSLGGDTPQEKRQRVRSPVDARGKDKTLLSTDAVESDKPNEPTLLEISANEKLFNIGKSSRSESKPDALRMTRTGLQKEGSRVIFGVPKPGKKRKFMEVSKHYVADGGSKANATNESDKLTKYLMPQGSGSRGWKNTSKTESNEKRAALLKPKVLRSGKTPSVSGRIIHKESTKTTATSTSDGSASADNNIKSKEHVGHVENASGKHSLVELQSTSGSEGAAEGPMIFSSLAPSDNLSSKKMSSGNAKVEGASKGKFAPPGGKLGKIEENKIFIGGSAKSTSDVIEPRRSNRRIQPTSRLLEGLQSSLMVTKIPSVSHDKSQRGRSVSRG